MMATGAVIPARLIISAGKKVQYPPRNSAAQTKTEGTQAFVLVEITSPV
jgi:hypothetical protein